jgi:hypothetical protein
MPWLDEKIREAQSSPSKDGSFYAITTSAGVVIVHQPIVLSCMGCLRYDCFGNTPTLTEKVITDEVIPGMVDANRI